jgi:hypothetical protein
MPASQMQKMADRSITLAIPIRVPRANQTVASRVTTVDSILRGCLLRAISLPTGTRSCRPQPLLNPGTRSSRFCSPQMPSEGNQSGASGAVSGTAVCVTAEQRQKLRFGESIIR